jgi:Zn-dependent peptidase ImmA (M78 family)
MVLSSLVRQGRLLYGLEEADGMTTLTLPSSPAGRIELLLRHSGVSKAQLARSLELPAEVSVEDVLAGEYQLSATDLVVVAELLDVPVTVLSGQVPMNRHLGVSLRLGTVEAPDVPADALEYADQMLRYRGLLDSWLGAWHSPLAGVGMSTDSFFVRAGRESAQRVRDGLELGEEPIADLVNLAERLGFPVVFRLLPEGMHGLNVQDEREGVATRLIIVSTRGPWTMQRYTIAHELGHALYDDAGQVIVDLVEIPDRLPELRADSFARHLLLPSAALKREVMRARRDGLSWEVLTAQLMVRWGMSRQAIVRTLKDDELANAEEIDVIERRRVDDLMAEAGLTKQWQALSAGQSEPCGSPWLVNRALEAYGHGWVGAHVVADLLGQDVETTKDQLVAQGWAEPDAYTA